MKLRHDVDGEVVRVRIEGELDATSCTCLENFWTLQVERHAVIDVDLAEADAGDGRGVAVLAALVRDSVRDGRRVVLRHAPQMLAHTLYKVGLAGVLVDPREEEPYG